MTLYLGFAEKGPAAISPTTVNIQLVQNGHTLAGFAIGALCLATMAILHLRVLHKTKTFSPIAILISC